MALLVAGLYAIFAAAAAIVFTGDDEPVFLMSGCGDWTAMLFVSVGRVVGALIGCEETKAFVTGDGFCEVDCG